MSDRGSAQDTVCLAVGLGWLLAELYEADQQPEPAAVYRRRGLAIIRRLGDRKSTAELLLAEAQTEIRQGRVRRSTVSQVREAGQLAAEVGWTEGVLRSEDVLKQAVARPSGPSGPAPAM